MGSNNSIQLSYSIHEQACKEFFDNLSLDLGQAEEQEGSRTYDITGWNALKIVSLLKSIVNSEESYIQDQLFQMKIKNQEGQQVEVFTLKAAPTRHQPGNGLLSRGEQRGKKYNDLVPLLEKKYRSDTCLFAQDLKKMFKSNEDIGSFDPATREIYMILLFEIARRLANLTATDGEILDETPKKKRLDKLPIGSAIAKIVKLLEAQECTFKDVFLDSGKFHCFSFGPDAREEAIKKIDEAYVKYELREMFSAEQQKQEPETEDKRDERSEADESVDEVARKIEKDL